MLWTLRQANLSHRTSERGIRDCSLLPSRIDSTSEGEFDLDGTCTLAAWLSFALAAEPLYYLLRDVAS